MWKAVSLVSFAAITIAAGAPAFADRDDWGHDRHHHYDGDRYDRGRAIEHRYYYPQQTVIIERPVVVEREVVVERPPVVYREAPRYDDRDARAPSSTLGAVSGALAGAVIGSRFGGGDGRIAAIAIGTVLGAHVGERLATDR